MKISAIDRIESPTDLATMPMTIRQRSAALPACALILVSTLSIGALLLPVTMIAVQGATDPRSAAAIMDRPATAGLLLAGLLVAVGLLAIPLRAGLTRLGHRAAVQLVRDRVAVEDRSLIGGRRWEASLREFTGVTHHIRATLSGPRHEIILVHPDRNKDILLNLSARPPQHGAEQFASLLDLDVIHASVLYGRRAAGLVMQPAAA